ncbi:MAG: hypothetical protein K8S99_00420 [Planctomycetes bacterium]|nr:hypothetical protein [Planctomycetota bacterium]
MLNLRAIDRHFHLGRFDLLADAVADNGLGLPLPLRVRVTGSRVAAVAMGLKRVIELTYGPTSLSREMTSSLLTLQQPDGSFEGDPLATAAVLAALNLINSDQPRACDPAVALAREHALAALAAMQDDDGLFHTSPLDRTEQDRALTAAFVLLILGRDPEFRAAIRFADLLNWFDTNAQTLDADTHQLLDTALAGLTAGPGTPPRRNHNLAAIAA